MSNIRNKMVLIYDNLSLSTLLLLHRQFPREYAVMVCYFDIVHSDPISRLGKREREVFN